MISMKDVAARAGVSQSAVSFVLNGRQRNDGSISEETRRRVLQTAAELGYRRNELSRAVLSGKNRMIGFLNSARNLEFEARMMSGILDEAQARDYTVKIVRVSDVETGRRHIERCVELRLAGLIALLPFPDALAYLRTEMKMADIPLILLDSEVDAASEWNVRSDHIEGMRQAMEHLVQLGHRRIAYLGGDPISFPSRQRESGYRDAMQRHGFPVPEGYVAWTDYRIEPTAQATGHLLTQEAERPTAIVCANDAIALIVLRTARQLGVRVPEDLSVVGNGDQTMASYADPPLTTVTMDFEEVGRAAATLLFDHINNHDKGSPLPASGAAILPPRLTVRESTGPAAN